VHVDIKQLGRISIKGAGHRMVGHKKTASRVATVALRAGITRFEYVHVMVDDHNPPRLRRSPADTHRPRRGSAFPAARPAGSPITASSSAR